MKFFISSKANIGNLKISLLAAVVVVFCICSLSLQGKPSRKNDGFKAYEVENAGVGNDGTYVLRVWTTSKSSRLSVEISKMNAVHAVLFKGLPSGNGSSAKSPLAGADAEEACGAFFASFFESDYARFVNSVAVTSTVVYKLPRNRYRTGVVISVAKDELRRYLEDNGIVKRLDAGF